jgi:hypothetical protein
LVHGRGVHASAHAISITDVALGLSAFVAAALAVALLRPRGAVELTSMRSPVMSDQAG